MNIRITAVLSAAVLLLGTAPGRVGSRALARSASRSRHKQAVDTSSQLPTAATFEHGEFCGAIVDAATGKPVPGALVAVRNRKGKVVAWSRTDAEGRYTIAADTLKTLQLAPSHHRNLLEQLAGDVHHVVTLPGKIAAGTVDAAATVVKDTVITGAGQTMSAATQSLATGSPLPVVGKIAGDTVKAVKGQVVSQSRSRAVESALGKDDPHHRKTHEALAPGEVELEVTAPGYKPVKGPAAAFWVQAGGSADGHPNGGNAVDSSSPGNKPPSGPQDSAPGPVAWLDPAKLAPVSAKANSEIVKQGVTISDPQLDPAMATPGTPVKISVKVEVPPGPKPDLRVFAREEKSHGVAELKPGAGGVYSGELPLDPKVKPGDTTIVIAALHTDPLDVHLQGRKDDPLLQFAGQVDEMDASRPYQFDPRVMASENRLDLPFTILDPKVGTPPATPPATATGPAPPAPTPTPGTQPPANPATPAPSPPGPGKPAPTPTTPAPPATPPATPKAAGAPPA